MVNDPRKQPISVERPPGVVATSLAIVVGLLGAMSACGGTASTPRPGSGGTTVDAALDPRDGGSGGVGAGGGGSGGTAVGGVSGRSGSGGRGGSGGVGAGGASPARACPGYVPPSGIPCRSSAECFGGFCTPTPGPSGCGFQSQPMHLCFTDAECPNGFCLPGKTRAPCATGPDIVCIPRCTATSCAAGERCGADGHCEIFPCTEGFACPAGLTCAPTRTGIDPNGCASASCATDGWTCSAPHTHCEPGAKNGNDGHGCAPDTCDTGAWTCGANQACGAPGDVHGCHCTSDAACGQNSRCDRTRGVCATKACAVDTDCDCGVCINQTCQPGLWACQLMAA